MEIPKSKQPNNYVIFLLFLDILHFFFLMGPWHFTWIIYIIKGAVTRGSHLQVAYAWKTP